MLLYLREIRLFLAAILLVVFASITARPALADSYALSVVSYSQHENFIGIDSGGDFAINLTADHGSLCGVGASTCFATYYAAHATPSYSVLAPTLNFDNGTSCAPVLFPGFAPQHGICNNGRVVVGGMDASILGVWDSTNLATNLLTYGSFDGGFMNGNGDVVFEDGFNNTLVFAKDLTSPVPELGGWVLLGTGCISMLGFFAFSMRD